MNIHNVKNKNNSHTRGFTLIETLVAIFILLISTTGPLSFAQSGLRASFQARDQVTALYLAQDSIETIKNIRDTARLANKDNWLEGIGACTPDYRVGSVTCNIGSTVSPESCHETTCPALRYNPVTYQFLSDSDSNLPPSKYTRTVYMTDVAHDQEVQIVVVVSWDLARKSIVVQENIYNK